MSDRAKAPDWMSEDPEETPDDADMAPESDDGEYSLPPDFRAHAAKALGTDDPEALQALYDAIESCGQSSGGHGGLDVVIGLGKGKKR